MPRVDRPELVLVAALALTLGVKALVAVRVPMRDEARFSADLAAMLRGHGYSVTVEDRPGGVPLLRARLGACRLAARAIRTSNGEFDRSDAAVLGAAGPVVELYGGGYSPPAPRLGATIVAQAQRELDRIGLAPPIRPVISLAAPPGCRPPPAWFASLRLHMKR